MVIYKCNYCDREYKSSSARLLHYNTKHKEQYIQDKNNEKEQTKKYICKYCNHVYSSRQSRHNHKKNCNAIKETNKYNELKTEINELKDKLNSLLTNKKNIEKNNNITNNAPINNTTNNAPINNTTNKAPVNNTTNNGTINNTTNIINIVNYGDENLSNILQNSEMLKLLAQYKQRAIEESIKAVHFNDDRPEYKNIYITCLDSDIIYVYNQIAKNFVEASQKEVINTLINEHCNCIIKTIEESKKDISKNDYNRIHEFINRIYFGNTEFKHHDFKEPFPTFRDYKIASVKLIIYKNSNKINKII
jgi:hypothetical protein